MASSFYFTQVHAAVFHIESTYYIIAGSTTIISEQGGIIKTESIFRILSEITEALSMTDTPKRLLDTATDTISRALGADCCWVQVINPNDNERPLSAYCGFSPNMRNKMGGVNLSQQIGHEVVGIGKKIVVPDLSRNGHFDLSLFTKAGFRSLIVVPVITYRPRGILGTAYKEKRRFTRDDSELMTVMASLIGMALSKSLIFKQIDSLKKTRISKDSHLAPAHAGSDGCDHGGKPPDESLVHEHGEDYTEHLHKMRLFKSSHDIKRHRA